MISLASSPATFYLHPVFPWEGANGEGGGVTLLLVGALMLFVAGLALFFIIKLFRRIL